MAAIHDLLKQIANEKLRERIAQEWEAATKHKKFGLVFERHLPELVPLWKTAPRRGDLVALRSGTLTQTWRVRRTEGDVAILTSQQAAERSVAAERVRMPLADLVVVKQFGEAIFPTLTPVESVCNGRPDAPAHVLIEADNSHALQLLEYVYLKKNAKRDGPEVIRDARSYSSACESVVFGQRCPHAFRRIWLSPLLSLNYPQGLGRAARECRS
jgi:adenine-specific DNA-methyltransferase